jgi:hypothetical protein
MREIMNFKILLCFSLIFSNGMSSAVNLKSLVTKSIKLITQKREFSKQICTMSSIQDKDAKLSQLKNKSLSNQKRCFSKTPMRQGILGAQAGFLAGKFLTHFVCHSTILIIGVCTGPAAPATIAALEAT